MTYIYIHGRGGNHNVPVGGQNYEFDISLPKCSGLTLSAFCAMRELPYNVVNLPFGGLQPIVTKIGGNKAHVVVPNTHFANMHR